MDFHLFLDNKLFGPFALITLGTVNELQVIAQEHPLLQIHRIFPFHGYNEDVTFSPAEVIDFQKDASHLKKLFLDREQYKYSHEAGSLVVLADLAIHLNCGIQGLAD